MFVRRLFASNCYLKVAANFKSPALKIEGWRLFCVATSSSIQNENDSSTGTKDKKLSKAMRAYLERARAYNEFIKKEEAEYNIGKRHLANMMGCDPETFTQEQIDEAIEYLFPSGIFEKKARPMMKTPKEIFPPKKDAQFDESGRPFHFLFYTGKPNFYSLLHEIASHFKTLDAIEDRMLMENKNVPAETLALGGTDWITKEELELKIVESLTDKDYKNFVISAGRLADHKYAFKIKDFIMNIRKPLMDTSMTFQVPKPLVDKDGRMFITTKDCPRKSARAHVTVRSPGTGLITINGKDIEYFTTVQSRGQILFPLELSGLLGSVDIEATVSGGGETGQAGAVRWGIAWGLRSFVTSDMVETMRLAGLLTRDFRRRERKKPGQEKARKKFTWKKR